MSGRKNFIKKKQESNVSLGASFTTSHIDLNTLSIVGYHVATSDVTTNVGTFGVQHRVNVDVNNTSEWCDLTLDPIPTLANADQILLITATLPPGQCRLKFNSQDEAVQTLTFPAKAAATNGDYIVVGDSAGTSYAVALVKPIAEVQTLTFPSVAGSTGGDYVVLTDGSGLTWAISLDKSGADPEPTGAAWVAVNVARKVHVDISGGTNAASVAALVETAFDGLSGSSAIVTDDTAADGTMLLTMAVKAPCTDPAVHNADDSGAGSITGVQTTAGVASQTPTGAAWAAADYKGLADLSSDTTAAQVAARAETALNALTGFTTNITSDDTAADGTMTLTQVNPGAVANVDPHNFNDSSAGSITGVNTSAGNGTADVYVSAAME